MQNIHYFGILILLHSEINLISAYMGQTSLVLPFKYSIFPWSSFMGMTCIMLEHTVAPSQLLVQYLDLFFQAQVQLWFHSIGVFQKENGIYICLNNSKSYTKKKKHKKSSFLRRELKIVSKLRYHTCCIKFDISNQIKYNQLQQQQLRVKKGKRLPHSPHHFSLDPNGKKKILLRIQNNTPQKSSCNRKIYLHTYSTSTKRL